ncbi:hypothetical protein [Modestobacter altitudinis]|uniref:hypothetical protein n=1 Tax=Modestobacter altitudinis TaxID=2213158 RepID=UPI00110C9AC1|nr:hypothetical protein [Modestobacter altitudinis]
MDQVGSKAEQETTVAEGLAIGCLVLGVTAVDNQDADTAFRRAWAEWPHAKRYPHVKASFERNAVPRILSKSEGRTGSYLAFWAADRGFAPHLRPSWDLQGAIEELTASTGLTAADWTDLARRFVKALGDDHVQRDGTSA